MKKKFLLLLLMMVPLMVVGAYAAPKFAEGTVATADITLVDACVGMCEEAPKEGCLDKFGGVDLRLVGGNSGIPGQIIQGNMKSREYFIIDGNMFLCEERWKVSTRGIEGLNYLVYEVATDLSDTKYNRCYSALNSLYAALNTHLDDDPDNDVGNYYEILQDIMDLEDFIAKCDKFRESFTLCEIENGDGNIYQMLLKNEFYQAALGDNSAFNLFSINNNDLVAVKSTGGLWKVLSLQDPLEEVKISPFNHYKDDGVTVLICEPCSQCMICHEITAIGECGAGYYLSYGCLNHACLFVQHYVIDSFQGEEEGLICQSQFRVGGSLFCKDHKCQFDGCTAPQDYLTEGVSISGDGTLTFNAHGRSNSEGDYSPYCLTHRCKANGCAEAVWMNNSTKQMLTENLDYLSWNFDPNNYCAYHSARCTVCDESMDKSDFDITGQHYCSEHTKVTTQFVDGTEIMIETPEGSITGTLKEGITFPLTVTEDTKIFVNGKEYFMPVGEYDVVGIKKATNVQKPAESNEAEIYYTNNTNETEIIKVYHYGRTEVKELKPGESILWEDSIDGYEKLEVQGPTAPEKERPEVNMPNMVDSLMNSADGLTVKDGIIYNNGTKVVEVPITNADGTMGSITLKPGESHSMVEETQKDLVSNKPNPGEADEIDEGIDNIREAVNKPNVVNQNWVVGKNEKIKIEIFEENGEVSFYEVKANKSFPLKIEEGMTVKVNGVVTSVEPGTYNINGVEKEENSLENESNSESESNSENVKEDSSNSDDKNSTSNPSNSSSSSSKPSYGGSGSGSSSSEENKTCTHNSRTIKYNTVAHWTICNLCGKQLTMEAHSYAVNSNQCTGCSYQNTVAEDNGKVVALKKLLNVSGTQYDSYIKNNLWTYDAIAKLCGEDIFVPYEKLTQNVDVKTYLQLLSKVVYQSGAYSQLDPRNFESLEVTVYPEWKEDYNQDYEFIMLAYGNAFGDKGELQGKGMYETFFLGYEEWLEKPITRYEMMALASALFDFSETEWAIDVSEAPERFVPYVKKAVTSGWYGPYQQDGKTATINQLYLSEEVDIFNTYAFLEKVYSTLMNDQIKYNGFIMNLQLYNAIYNKDCEHNYIYDLTNYVHNTGSVTHTLLCDKCGYVFVSGTHQHSFETSCQECVDIISQYNNPDDTTINDDEAEQEYKDSMEIEDAELPKPAED